MAGKKLLLPSWHGLLTYKVSFKYLMLFFTNWVPLMFPVFPWVDPAPQNFLQIYIYCWIVFCCCKWTLCSFLFLWLCICFRLYLSILNFSAHLHYLKAHLFLCFCVIIFLFCGVLWPLTFCVLDVLRYLPALSQLLMTQSS